MWSKGGVQFGGVYSYSYYLSNGAEAVCQSVNGMTGSCSCPAGYSGWSVVTGQGYHNSPWDIYWDTVLCLIT